MNLYVSLQLKFDDCTFSPNEHSPEGPMDGRCNEGRTGGGEEHPGIEADSLQKGQDELRPVERKFASPLRGRQAKPPLSVDNLYLRRAQGQ